MNLLYQLKNWENYKRTFLLILVGLTVHYATRFYDKPKPNIQALDLAISKMQTDAVIKYCRKTKGKQLIIRSTGSESINVCNRFVWKKPKRRIVKAKKKIVNIQ